MGRDTLDSIRKLKELKTAREASGKKVSEHIQPVLQSAGPPKKIGLIGKAKLIKQAVTLYKITTSPTMKISGSWKTSLFSTGGLATIGYNIASMLLDGDPATNPDWGVYLPLILAAAIGLFARDNDKSSQDVGLRPEAK